MKPYSEWKHDLLQVLGTALAVAALVVPLLQWAIDSKMDALGSKIEVTERASQERQNALLTEVKAVNTRLDDMYKYIDAKTDKK